MINVLVTTDPRYHVNRKAIREAVENKLTEQGIQNAEVSVAVVGSRKMAELCKLYMNDGIAHTVLSFPFQESPTHEAFVEAPDKVIRLGDIILSHPKIVEEAAEENILVSEKIQDLIEHSVMHLLGHHHHDHLEPNLIK